MIELAFLALAVVVLGSFAVMVFAAITVSDLKTIAIEKALQLHPHARKWRGVTSLRKNLLFQQDERFIGPKTIRFALARFQANPILRFVEIIPRLEFPQTMHEFFAAYHQIALAPFIKVRALLNVHTRQQNWPTFAQKDLAPSFLDRLYPLYVWLVNVINLALFIYVANIAIALDQPDYLMAYMTAFGLWLAWSITNHPGLVWRQKIAYLILAPASFVYFLWRILAAPFSPLRQIDVRSIFRILLSLDV
ncbi:MAG: hypothetical protein JWO07_252 [Candidatus Saccharibacteria bacterium]|nr:hypothetical protein [Candidatus Saccharibacteria bacterium]